MGPSCCSSSALRSLRAEGTVGGQPQAFHENLLSKVNWRLYPQGRRTEPACPQYSAVQHQFLWAATACVDFSSEVEENVLHKTGKPGAAGCLGGSYCSFTIIFFCKVLNCKKLIFCSVNWPLYFEFAYTGTMGGLCLKRNTNIWRNLGYQKVLRSGKRIEGLNSEDLFPSLNTAEKCFLTPCQFCQPIKLGKDSCKVRAGWFALQGITSCELTSSGATKTFASPFPVSDNV